MVRSSSAWLKPIRRGFEREEGEGQGGRGRFRSCLASGLKRAPSGITCGLPKACQTEAGSSDQSVFWHNTNTFVVKTMTPEEIQSGTGYAAVMLLA